MTALHTSDAEVLHPGSAEGCVLKLEDPLSFWGGFDPKDGRILDQAHPQAGQRVTGAILVMPGSRGSAGTPAGIAEAVRLGVGPAAILLQKRDVNITIGVQVAKRLYQTSIPVLEISQATFDGLRTGQSIAIYEGRLQSVS